MNSLEMVKENVLCASGSFAGEFTEDDRAVLKEVVKALTEGTKVGCTGCRYCMPCPKGVDIPGTFAAYNTRYRDGWFTATKEYIKCGLCEKHCPQGIAIRQELANARKTLEGPVYKVAKRVIPIFMKY